MIPKIIHLCWLSGDPYPEKIAKCISTWKKHLPDYEIMLWDTNRFDVNSTRWTKEAFEARKYAFVTDYIRFYAVYNYGGIYLDSDVEMLKSFDSLLDLPYFIGKECNDRDLEVAAFGAEAGTSWIKECLDYYSDRAFRSSDGTLSDTSCAIVMRGVLGNKFVRKEICSLSEFSREAGTLCVFPTDYFCAHRYDSSKHESWYCVSDNTFSVHHFAHSWVKFPGGPLHRLYYQLTGKPWVDKYYPWKLIQE